MVNAMTQRLTNVEVDSLEAGEPLPYLLHKGFMISVSQGVGDINFGRVGSTMTMFVKFSSSGPPAHIFYLGNFQ